MDATPAAMLLRWYDRHRRTLPWRSDTPDPYRIWLSEIMLQQTTTSAVAPYYERFLARWPDVTALARANDADVMGAWAGLGYYARARNLLACARQVAADHDGEFPDTEAALRALPGIGAYTAAAIAAIAFGKRAVVIDGNVERVVSRLFAIETPLPASRPDIRRRTDAITPDERPGDFAQAMMDLGATICTPTRPACILCPLRDICAARRSSLQDALPRKAAKPIRPSRTGYVFVGTRADGAILVRTRPPRGLLGGMTEFPGIWPLLPDSSMSWEDAAPLSAEWQLAGQTFHGFTHFDLTLTVFQATVSPSHAVTMPLRWIDEAAWKKEAFPTLMRKVAAVAGLAVDNVSGRAAPGPARKPREPDGTNAQKTRSRGPRGQGSTA